MDNETLFSQCPVVSGCVISFSVFYRNLFLYYYYYYNYNYYYYYYCYYYYYYFIFSFFYSVVAEWNCLLLLSCLDKSYIVLQVWLLRFVRVVPYLKCFSNFGLSGFRPEFVIFSFVTLYGQLSPWLVSVLGLDRCFHSDSLLYLVFSLNSYWSFVFHPSVNLMPCAFRPAYIGLK